MNKPDDWAMAERCSRAASDHRPLRDALGAFATGVTVVTTVDACGRAVGLTVNSFNAVSLDPPLILWSLSRASPNVPTFVAASHFAVNVLAAGQQRLAQRFAERDADKFAGVDWHAGLGGVPILAGCCAVLECRNERQHDGGDHLIFIGRIERFGREDAEPLLYFGGRYRFLRG